MNSLVRRLATLLTAVAVVTPVAAVTGGPAANAAVPAIQASAFGTHWVDINKYRYPIMPFGTARIWDMGVDWAQLQPSQTTVMDPSANGALASLDYIVNTFAAHHVDPLLTIGMTPSWAAANCQHYVDGQEWGDQTCPAQDTSVSGPWGQYVAFLANRYAGKVHYFEMWNEPSLHNGYNGSMSALAQMQASAYSIVHSYGIKLVSPGIPFTNGSWTNGYNWLKSYLSQPGAKDYDIFGVHLYPSDTAARGGYGPEWSILSGLTYAKNAVAAAKAPVRPIWNTEYNVGRRYASPPTGYRDTAAGAGPTAQSFILATQWHIARTFWYAADERRWGGTWLEKSDFYSLSPAGYAERTAYRLLVGKAPLGCTKKSVGTNKWRFTCYFGTTTKHKTLIAIWTNGARYTYHAPHGTKSYYTATGGHKSAGAGKAFTITSAPVYIAGSF
jgi:hypothetical protein